MPRSPHSTEDRDRIRRRILAAAHGLFDEGGMAAVSMRAVGAQAGLTASALYAYFPGKDDLLRALWQGPIDDLHHRLRTLSEAEPDPMRALIGLAHAYAAFGLEDPVRFRLLFFTPPPPGALSNPPEAPPHVRIGYQILHKRVTEAIGHDLLRIDDADLASQTLWAALHGVVALINGCTAFPFEPPAILVETMIDTTLRGLGRGLPRGDGR